MTARKPLSDAQNDLLAPDRAILLNEVFGMRASARSHREIAEILKALPSDVGADALRRAVHDHEQIAAHEVGPVRLCYPAEMLRSAARSGSSRLNIDKSF